MSCQLCYRTREGQAVYSAPVFGGDCSLKLDLEPANNVVFAVICNTDYIYTGEETRKAHFDYRLQLVEGVIGTADIHKRFYDWTKTISSPLDIEPVSSGHEIVIYPNPVNEGSVINISFINHVAEPIEVRIMNLSGQLLWAEKVTGNTSISAAHMPGPGIYFASFQTQEGISIHKIIVR